MQKGTNRCHQDGCSHTMATDISYGDTKFVVFYLKIIIIIAACLVAIEAGSRDIQTFNIRTACGEVDFAALLPLVLLH